MTKIVALERPETGAYRPVALSLLGFEIEYPTAAMDLEVAVDMLRSSMIWTAASDPKRSLVFRGVFEDYCALSKWT